MFRLLLICGVAASLLTSCASDTTNSGASSAGRGGVSSGGQFPGGQFPGGQPSGGAGGQDDLVRYAGDRIYFETDQSLITPEARDTLERQVRWLQQNQSIRIWVAGNCDERGTEEYNLALGQRRAHADRDYLVSRGIGSGRIETISYGKTRPVDPDSTLEGWAHNRNAITSVR